MILIKTGFYISPHSYNFSKSCSTLWRASTGLYLSQAKKQEKKTGVFGDPVEEILEGVFSLKIAIPNNTEGYKMVLGVALMFVNIL